MSYTTHDTHFGEWKAVWGVAHQQEFTIRKIAKDIPTGLDLSLPFITKSIIAGPIHLIDPIYDTSYFQKIRLGEDAKKKSFLFFMFEVSNGIWAHGLLIKPKTEVGNLLAL